VNIADTVFFVAWCLTRGETFSASPSTSQDWLTQDSWRTLSSTRLRGEERRTSYRSRLVCVGWDLRGLPSLSLGALPDYQYLRRNHFGPV